MNHYAVTVGGVTIVLCEHWQQAYARARKEARERARVVSVWRIPTLGYRPFERIAAFSNAPAGIVRVK